MPAATISFPNKINISVQIGDNLYYSVPIDNQSGVNHPSNATSTQPILLGVITAIGTWNGSAQTVTVGSIVNSVVGSAHYFFSKDNNANLTSLVGYFAEVEIRNNSTIEAEMYQITTDFTESSK
tara:strand:- start:1686 stop:2057 length:372 start_codon:yes stop_codon:yes gene_type:complete